MRISDWSSDVCSSDLLRGEVRGGRQAEPRGLYPRAGAGPAGLRLRPRQQGRSERRWIAACAKRLRVSRRARLGPRARRLGSPARKSVVWGKRVSVRVDLGGRRIIKKKNKQYYSS